MKDRHKKIIAASGIALFVLLSGAVFWFVGKPLLAFVSEPEKFRLWVDSHGLWGRLAFLGMMLLQIFVAIIPGEPLEIGAGYAFGAVEGTLLCLLGAGIGSCLVFLFVRRFGVKAVEVFIPQEKIASLKFLQNTRRVYLFMTVVFLLPGTPKDALCYCAGLTSIRFSHFLVISSICRLPSVITSVVGGNALGSGDWQAAIWIFLVTMAVSILGLLLYNRILRYREEHHHGAN